MKLWRRVVLACFSAAGVLNIALWVGVYWLIPRDTITVIIHYSSYLGPDLFGQWYDLLWLPGAGLATVVINALLTRWLWRAGSFMNLMLALATLFCQLILLTALIFILSINRLI